MEASLFFIIVVAINSAAVYLQRRFKTYTQLFGRYDWAVHVILLAVIWVAFVLALIFIQPPIWKLSLALRPLGVAVVAIGTWMVILTWVKLGTTGVCNGWFFGRGPTKQLRGGVFRLRNPMYTGFVLLFIGAAFWIGNAFYLWMAAVSFLLLNLVQARVERPATRRWPN